eukprot:TRINITY_DN5185_c0_g2_i1.p1 TRINITY_DN5185_c0_g2~~TRINITY_DN5185_c0_g2_i1.p1  ORF type:complete len:303 (+),score=37.75 TRINITY_DN5185_c0_g2_i1:30-911(+)
MAGALPNPNLRELENDFLYHLGYSAGEDLPGLFGDVRVVVTGGSTTRMEKVAHMVKEHCNLPVPFGTELSNLSRSDRYGMWKVGPVLCVNHGMGCPSVSIMLHEVTKLLAHAGIAPSDLTYFRVGTSGGLIHPAGTLVVTEQSYNSMLEPHYPIAVCGKMQYRETKLDPVVADQLLELAPEGVNVVKGNTMAAETFYESQGRLDGAICEHTMEDKFNFLRRAVDKGIANIEMESTAFAAFCHKAGVHGAVVCATLLNRMDGDQVTSAPELLKAYAESAIRLVLDWINKHVIEA